MSKYLFLSLIAIRAITTSALPHLPNSTSSIENTYISQHMIKRGLLSPLTDLGNNLIGKAKPNPRPDVHLDYGNFIGINDDTVDSFTGIPFAEPPIGDRRLRESIPPLRTYPNFDASNLPPACTQKLPTTGHRPLEKLLSEAELLNTFTPLIGPIAVGQEDCLTLDVRRPSGVQKGAGLPVMVYIYGGAVEFGATNIYNGAPLVAHSIRQGAPIIYVAMNYRLHAFGFLGGKQVLDDGATNLGLKDTRLALKWVQKYIVEFGGDPTKVTIFGESAGAIIVSHHMTAQNGQNDGLFRAAICQSGTALPTTRLADGGGQHEYDELVRNAGCANHQDSLQCLREIDYDTFYRAFSAIDGPFEIDGVPLRWNIHIDGEFVTDTLQASLSKGNYAKVPIITGDQDDEGTVLTVGLLPLFTEERLEPYLSKLFFQNASPGELQEVLRLYPQDPSAGSPYGTGLFNTLTPIFKQVSSLFGDCQFQAPRRKFSQMTQAHMPVWGYIDRGYKLVPVLGAFHGTDVPNVFGYLPGPRTEEYQTRWISFANTMNPNVPGLPDWPNYGDEGTLLEIGFTGSIGTTPDNFRQEAMEYLNNNPVTLALQPM